MRNLSIADALRNAGEKCRFILADNCIADLIRARGYEYNVLGTAYDHMEPELEKIHSIICETMPIAMFVDSYFVTVSYLNDLHSICAINGVKLAYVDDVIAFPYSCDVLLNYNIYASAEKYTDLYRDTELPRLALGTAYTPLRGEFQNLPDRITRRTGRNILISTGGADSEHIGVELVRTIAEHAEYNDYQFHFIIGAMNEDQHYIREIAENSNHILLHVNVGNMSELMQSCDVAVSAAGSTLYELCATQTPTITYILADNQIFGANGFEERGVLRCVGDIRALGLKRLAEQIIRQAIELADDYNARCTIANKMRTVVDGKGACRVAEMILGG